MTIAVLKKITADLGEQSVLTGGQISEKYKTDWSGATGRFPFAVVRPRSTEELSIILKHCHALNQKVVVQGGMTGMSGGSISVPDELALSLELMSGIEEIDADSMTMTVLAGTPLQLIQEAAENAGTCFPLDLGSKGSCTIGGNISTNAGGNQVLRYGMTRALILGLETVLADGTVVSSMNKMLKNNAAYDLKHNFIGSEGTLGIVTRAVLRLYPQSNSVCTALCALQDFDSTIKLLKDANSRLPGGLSTFEVMWSSYFDFVTANVQNIKTPFEQKFPIYALIEAKGAEQQEDMHRFETFLENALETKIVSDAVIAQSKKEATSLWSLRDAVAELTPLLKTSVNFDVSIPIGSMQKFIEEVKYKLEEVFPGLTILVFGHIGDGNLHVSANTGKLEDKDSICDIVYGLTGQYQGSISGEHGIGTLKKKYLPLSRTDAEIRLMRKLKDLFDPKGILNSGRVI